MAMILSMSAYGYAMDRKEQRDSMRVVKTSLQDAFYTRSLVIKSIQQRTSEPSKIFSESAISLIGHLFVAEV